MFFLTALSNFEKRTLDCAATSEGFLSAKRRAVFRRVVLSSDNTRTFCSCRRISTRIFFKDDLRFAIGSA